jgi:hypothetical protein
MVHAWSFYYGLFIPGTGVPAVREFVDEEPEGDYCRRAISLHHRKIIFIANGEIVLGALANIRAALRISDKLESVSGSFPVNKEMPRPIRTERMPQRCLLSSASFYVRVLNKNAAGAANIHRRPAAKPRSACTHPVVSIRYQNIRQPCFATIPPIS